MTDEPVHLTHLEYSFLLHTTNLGPEVRHSRNPFTGEAMTIPIDHGLTTEESAALVRALRARGFAGPEPSGEGYVRHGLVCDYLRVRLFDGENGTRPVSLPVELVVRRLDDDFLAIVLELASVANCALMTPVGSHVCVPKDVYRDDLPRRWPDVRQITHLLDLRTWFERELRGRRVWIPEETVIN